MDYCGVKSGRDVDKFQKLKLQTEPASEVGVPMIKDAPVCIECRVTEVKHLGSHGPVFLQKCWQSTRRKPTWTGREDCGCRMRECWLILMENTTGLGKKLGTFGFSVRRRKTGK